MNPNCLDISKTLMNNTLHAPWIGAPGLEKTGIMIDDFLMFVRWSKTVADVKCTSQVLREILKIKTHDSYNSVSFLRHWEVWDISVYTRGLWQLLH